MSRNRFLPVELRNKIIDSITAADDKLDDVLMKAISDSWTDTKLIKALEQRTFLFKLAGMDQTVEIKNMQSLQEEIADYVLLEELNGKKNSGN